MAKTSDEVKFKKKQRFEVRFRNRCPFCGRARAYMRRFGMCRICFRERALQGEIPGVRKISW
ncbi:type Z 30S ribosomal protein S14 [Candidatus Roizmanbacteria bacterium]|nr:type Z 30S ribosomal protein S14 [Candidatus Roizmanbacteria bacterium]